MLDTLWQTFCLPLLRLLFGLSIGLLLANLLEALNWTVLLAKFCRPFARTAHLGTSSQAAFTMAFLSPAAANALLSEKHSQGFLSTKELVLSNLFNSLPAYFVHTPSIFFLMWPVLGFCAVTYVGLSLLAALLRTLCMFFVCRALLPAQDPIEETVSDSVSQPSSFASALKKAYLRLKRRLPRLLLYSIPIYILMYILQKEGFFTEMQGWLSQKAFWTNLLSPQAAGIIVLHFLAELGSALGAAASLLSTGGMTESDVVLALLIGNILSTPLRAVRHQLPSYAGFFSPGLGLRLIIMNQTLRALSMCLVTFCYVLLRP